MNGFYIILIVIFYVLNVVNSIRKWHYVGHTIQKYFLISKNGIFVKKRKYKNNKFKRLNSDTDIFDKWTVFKKKKSDHLINKKYVIVRKSLHIWNSLNPFNIQTSKEEWEKEKEYERDKNSEKKNKEKETFFFSILKKCTSFTKLILRCWKRQKEKEKEKEKNQNKNKHVSVSFLSLQNKHDFLNEFFKRLNIKENIQNKISYLYPFFQKKENWYEKQNTLIIMLKKQLHINSHFYFFNNLYNIQEMENIYKPSIITNLYLFRKNMEIQYLKNYPLHLDIYSNSFVLLYPPPNLSGTLHIGHYFNFILQNIIFLFNKHINGKYVIPIFGTDHGGLSAHESFNKLLGDCNISEEKYVSEIQKWQMDLKKKILKQLEEMNIIVNEKEFYNTMDIPMKDIVNKAFFSLYIRNFIEKKYHPLYFCRELNTVVPYSDLNFKKVETKSVFIKLSLVNIAQNKKKEEKFYQSEINEEEKKETSQTSQTSQTLQTLQIKKQTKLKEINNINKNNTDVKFFLKENFPFKFFTEKEIKSLKKSDYIYVQIDDIEELNNLVAIIYVSEKEDLKYNYVLLPFSNKAIPLIFQKKWNFHTEKSTETLESMKDGRKEIEMEEVEKMKDMKTKNVENEYIENENIENEYVENEKGEKTFLPAFSFSNKNLFTLYDINEQEPTIISKTNKNYVLKKLKEYKLIKDNSYSSTIQAFYKTYKCVLTLSHQWILKMDQLYSLYKKFGNTNFVIFPMKFKKWFFDNEIIKSTWCLSRQIKYGHEIPIYKYEFSEIRKDKYVKTKQDNQDNQDNQVIIKKQQTPYTCYIYGTNKEEVYEKLVNSNYFSKEEIIKKNIIKEKGVLDSWFSSALYFFYCLWRKNIDIYKWVQKRKKKGLIDFVYTGKDILYPWIIRSTILLDFLLTEPSFIHSKLIDRDHIKGRHPNNKEYNKKEEKEKENEEKEKEKENEEKEKENEEKEKNEVKEIQQTTYHNALIYITKLHGLIKDYSGKKISKSDKNASFYKTYLQNANVDSLRLCFSFIGKNTEDMILCSNYLKKSEKFLKKIWNIGNFIKKNGSYNMYRKMKKEHSLSDNKRIYNFLQTNSNKFSDVVLMEKYCKCVNSFFENMNSYNIYAAIQSIYEFVMQFFSKHYLPFYSLDTKNKTTRNFLLFHTFNGLLKMLYPFIPHITEILFFQIFSKHDKHNIEQTLLSSNYTFFKTDDFVITDHFVFYTYFPDFIELINFFKTAKQTLSDFKIVKIYVKLKKQEDPAVTYFINEQSLFETLSHFKVLFKSFQELKEDESLLKHANTYVDGNEDTNKDTNKDINKDIKKDTNINANVYTDKCTDKLVTQPKEHTKNILRNCDNMFLFNTNLIIDQFQYSTSTILYQNNHFVVVV